MNTTIAQPRCFKVSLGDLRPLWQLLAAPTTALSPYAALEARPPATDPAELAALAQDPALAQAANLLAAPQLKVECVIGGGSSALGYLTLCRRGDSPVVVATTPIGTDSLLVYSFADSISAGTWLARTLNTLPEFLAWDPATLESVAASPAPAHDLPSTLPLETLIYLFHAIDMYRAAVYRNLLQHLTVDEDLAVDAAEFDAALGRALQSGDIRWLLPAFHRLMPGLAACTLDPKPEHLDALSGLDIIGPVRANASAARQYRFGAAGQRLGLEFYRTWHGAVGISLSRADGVLPQSHFLAPTAFANHWFSLATDTLGHGMVEYAALDEGQLADRLRGLLDSPTSAPKPAPAPQPAAVSPPPTQPARHCPACQTPLAAGAMFCSACGTRAEPPAAEPARLACAHCHQPLEPGMRFCSSCGKPVAAPTPAAPTARRCPRCATVLDASLKFCTECGTRLP
jgi:hypothetical protein